EPAPRTVPAHATAGGNTRCLTGAVASVRGGAAASRSADRSAHLRRHAARLLADRRPAGVPRCPGCDVVVPPPAPRSSAAEPGVSPRGARARWRMAVMATTQIPVDLDILDPAVKADPYPAYEALRAR